jgi:hypothetical protein
MSLSGAQARSRITWWTERHKDAVLYDDESSILVDVVSGKTLHLLWQNVTACEEKIHAETGVPYWVLLFDSGIQLVLVAPGGIAFAPSTVNSGPVQELPQVVCLRDFYTLKRQLDHYLHDHPDDTPPHECLDWVMMCIAILDGARAVGFDVGDLEGELEKSLNELEKKNG